MSGPGLEIGVFAVRGSAAEAEIFRTATGLPSGGATLPLTFPMRWLAARDIRVALTALVGHGEVVLVHESQSFSYVEPLQVDRAYDLRLTVRREHAPDRLVLEGAITEAEGRACADVETILRLVAAPPEQGE